MKLFEKRPLCFACSAALILAAVSAYAGLFFAAAMLCVCAGGALVSVPLGGRVRRRVLVIAAVCAAVCASAVVRFASVRAVETGAVCRISGYVTADGDGLYRIVKIERQDGRRVDTCAVCYGDLPAGFSEFEADAVLSPYDGADGLRMRGKNVYFKAELSGQAEEGPARKNLRYCAEKLRSAASLCFYRVCDEAGVLCRLFLGRNDTAPYIFASDMRNIGLSHLLAVSGLHVTALLAGCDFILSRIFGKSRKKAVILSVIALLYMAVTGFSGSVTRAAVSYAVCSAAALPTRKYDLITTLTAVCAGVVIFDFNSVYDAGFVLSFSATLGIITLGSDCAFRVGRRLGASHPVLSGLLSSACVTLSALLFTLPAASLYYGRLAYGAVLYNGVAAPVVTLLLYLCPAVLLTSRIPFAGRALGLICDALCRALSAFAHAVSGSVPAVSVRYVFVAPLLCVLAAALITASFLTRRRRVYVCILLCFCLTFSALAAVLSLTFSAETVIIVSAGKYGDTVAVCERGRATVFDMTPGGSDGYYRLCEALLRYGVTHADYVLCSGSGGRQLQQLVTVCGGFDIRDVYVPADMTETARLLLHGNALAAKDVYGSVTVKEDDGVYLLIKDAVYVGSAGKSAQAAADGARTVIVGSLADADAMDLPPDTVYVLKNEGMSANEALTVIKIE